MIALVVEILNINDDKNKTQVVLYQITDTKFIIKDNYSVSHEEK